MGANLYLYAGSDPDFPGDVRIYPGNSSSNEIIFDDFLGDATFPHDVEAGRSVKPAAGTTANRPSASSVGTGGMWYDTDLLQPIWSDGADWRTADGSLA